jgi:hypothetical protein
VDLSWCHLEGQDVRPPAVDLELSIAQDGRPVIDG